MSVPFSGTLTRSGGVTSAIAKQLKTLTLKPVKKVQFQFDPFHEKIKETRYFINYITAPKILRTNLSCSFKTLISCDRSEPKICFTLANGEEIIFKSANLNALDMFKLYNKHISILAPKEELSSTALATKSTKKPVSSVKRKKN